MNLHSGTPFWLVQNGLMPTRPVLSADEQCDVAIIGAGITGALIADAMTTAGIDVIVLDRRESGVGSTAASTALLQYEIDVELIELSTRRGDDVARRAYLASARAVTDILSRASQLGACDSVSRSSLYLASTRRDGRRLQREADRRAAIGLPAEWWSRDEVVSRYGFPCHGAIRSTLAGEIDALAFTRQLLASAEASGARWYEQTEATDYRVSAPGVTLTTARGHLVHARTIVCATGYALPAFLRHDRVALHSTYALATERVESFGEWNDQSLVWESARPYCYMRTTRDSRVIIGGEDVPFKDAGWRDRLIPSKTRKLEERLRTLLPSIHTETAYEWAGTFAETPDGLPYIGTMPEYPGVQFALGYGGNGITFSGIAARVLTGEVLGESAEDADLYGFER